MHNTCTRGAGTNRCRLRLDSIVTEKSKLCRSRNIQCKPFLGRLREWATPWSAEELDGQRQRVNIPTHARAAHMAFCRKDWMWIFAESSVMFPRRPNRSRDWDELNWSDIVFMLDMCDCWVAPKNKNKNKQNKNKKHKKKTRGRKRHLCAMLILVIFLTPSVCCTEWKWLFVSLEENFFFYCCSLRPARDSNWMFCVCKWVTRVCLCGY